MRARAMKMRYWTEDYTVDAPEVVLYVWLSVPRANQYEELSSHANLFQT